MEIREILREIRERKKISRKELADKIFIAQETLRDIEIGKIRLTLENYMLICKELNISALELLQQNTNEHFVLLNKKDIDDLNRIIKKINDQQINILNSHKTINDESNITIGNGNNINNSFNKK